MEGKIICLLCQNGKVKTPETLLLLPSIIKQLTNNTEIINTVRRLSHSVSNSILKDMHTENAYVVHDQQENDDVVLSLISQKETFIIYSMLQIILTERKKSCQENKLVWINSPIRDSFFIYLFIHLFAFEEMGLTAKQWKSIDPVVLEFDWMLNFNQTNSYIIFKSIIISFT